MLRPKGGGAGPKLIFWAAALFALTMAIVPQPPQLPGEPNDKVQHMVAFGTLGLLGAWAYPRLALLQLLSGLSLFGAIIELVQAVPALHRDADRLDWLADTVAAGAALLVAWAVRRVRS